MLPAPSFGATAAKPNTTSIRQAARAAAQDCEAAGSVAQNDAAIDAAVCPGNAAVVLQQAEISVEVPPYVFQGCRKDASGRVVGGSPVMAP